MKKILLSLVLLCTVVQGAWADYVRYIYYTVNGDGKTITKHEDGTASNPTVLTGSLISGNTEDRLYDGWYVLNSSFSYGERIVIYGDVKLILQDGCTLTAEQGIRINTDATLTVYAQSESVGTMGKLVAIETHHDKAAIGGNKNYQAGKLFIHGGEIEAKCEDGSKYAAGIGGGYGDGSGMKEITIYGGKVTAQGAKTGAGIGGGKNNNHPGTINIYGGDITTDGGQGGAGIGGGQYRGDWPVNIYGGTVNAKGHGHGDYENAIAAAGAAGIGGGGGFCEQLGPINIYGGTVTAEGYYGAGIGGGCDGRGGEICIHGGTVTATGGVHAAGIGGGYNRKGGKIFIYGGTVTATGGDGGSAIGGGHGSIVDEVGIAGGYVTTIAFKGKGHSPAASNICSGADNQGGILTLGWDMCVKPQTGLVPKSERFKACWEPYYSSVDEWWTVEVYKCTHSRLHYTIENENEHWLECTYCNGGRKENHEKDEFGRCRKCDYGNDIVICANTFYETTTADYGDATHTLKAKKDNTIVLPTCTNIPEGMTFAGWLIADLSVVNGIEAADGEPLHPAGEVYTVTGNESFFARYRYDFTPTWTWNEYLTSATLTIQTAGGTPISVTPVTVGTPATVAATPEAEGSITNTATATYKSGNDSHGYTTYEFSTEHSVPQYWEYTLQDIYDNTSTLSTYEGKTGNVRLRDRTFYRDGSWNTLCLPFNVEDISSTPLAGATLKELTDASFKDGTLTLTFADATSIKAGQAYLIKWTDHLGYHITDVLFQGVTLINYLCDDEISTDDSGTATVTFMGTYKKLSYTADDKSILFLGDGNTLYYPQSGASIGAQRAYFKLSGITAGDKAAGVRSFVLDFGDGETTGIKDINLPPGGSQPSVWRGASGYTLDGRKLSTQPVQKGIYIYNGKKVIIK